MAGIADFGRSVQRTGLLERLRRLRPQLVALVAPAGFGKSTLARQFLEDRQVFAICDCADVSDDLDFARRLIPALADEQPESGAALSQRELMIGDGAMSSGERIALALAAWRRTTRPSTFVFEDAEHIANSPSAREFLTRLLAERPKERTVILCSRESLRVHLSRFAPPHEIVALRAEDLAFSRAEVEEILRPLSLDETVVERIFDISQGWPIPVLFLARLAYEGRHEALLAKLSDVAFEELHEYLADQVLAALPPPIVSVLFAAACIPNASAADLVAATGDPTAGATIAEFSRSSPFVRSAPDGTFIVHPLMRALLTEDDPAQRDALLAKTADEYDGRKDHLRAAELHLARPDQEAAARSLESTPVGEDRAPPMRYSRMVSALDRSIVRRYPTLWSCIALLQTFSADTKVLLEETGTLYATLPKDTPVEKRYYVIATRTLLLTYLGQFAEAFKLLESVEAQVRIPDPPTERWHGYFLYLRGTVLSRMGRLDAAERDLNLAMPLIEEMHIMRSAAEMIQAVEIDRARGETEKARKGLATSLASAKLSNMSNFVAYRLAEATFGEWLAGDDAEGFAAYAEDLERTVEGDGIRGFRYFTDCVRGRESEPRDVDLIRWVLCGRLVACASSTDPARALEHAIAAREAGTRYPNPFLQCLAAIAVAELSPERERAGLYAEALRLGESTDSPPLASAVAAAAARKEPGMLRSFVARLRAGGPSAVSRLEISLVKGTVRARGNEVKLRDRELELLFFLARRQETVARERLTATLWPDGDEDSTANTLKVLLHNLRQHLGDEGAIVRTREGLRLCDEAHVDLWEIDRAISARRSGEIANDAERATVLEIYQRLGGERPARVLGWEWFEPTERYIRELRSELGQRLARYALRARKPQEAVVLAEEAIANDQCDEAAQEIAILAYLDMDNRSAALRQFRRYREILHAELQCEPSPSLAKLLSAGAAQPASR